MNFFSMQEVQDALRKQGVSEEVAQKVQDTLTPVPTSWCYNVLFTSDTYSTLHHRHGQPLFATVTMDMPIEYGSDLLALSLALKQMTKIKDLIVVDYKLLKGPFRPEGLAPTVRLTPTNIDWSKTQVKPNDALA